MIKTLQLASASKFEQKRKREKIVIVYSPVWQNIYLEDFPKMFLIFFKQSLEASSRKQFRFLWDSSESSFKSYEAE